MEGRYLSFAVVATAREMQLQNHVGAKIAFVAANALFHIREHSLKRHLLLRPQHGRPLHTFAAVAAQTAPELQTCNCKNSVAAGSSLQLRASNLMRHFCICSCSTESSQASVLVAATICEWQLQMSIAVNVHVCTCKRRGGGGGGGGGWGGGGRCVCGGGEEEGGRSVMGGRGGVCRSRH